MKKIIITSIAIAFILTVSITSASAGSPSKHLKKHLEGVLIASNPAILGAAIINQLHNDLPRIHVYEPRHDNKRYRRHYRRHNSRNHYRYSSNRHRYMESEGHWRIKRRWIPEEYEERWNPGHYNKRGRWVPGRYKRFVVREGYWVEKRIWISHY
jgi:hypothetical protein